jgi:hypothetical protein
MHDITANKLRVKVGDRVIDRDPPCGVEHLGGNI